MKKNILTETEKKQILDLYLSKDIKIFSFEDDLINEQKPQIGEITKLFINNVDDAKSLLGFEKSVLGVQKFMNTMRNWYKEYDGIYKSILESRKAGRLVPDATLQKLEDSTIEMAAKVMTVVDEKSAPHILDAWAESTGFKNFGELVSKARKLKYTDPEVSNKYKN